jgi:predicted RNA-binding Zn ribbon-like protein
MWTLSGRRIKQARTHLRFSALVLGFKIVSSTPRHKLAFRFNSGRLSLNLVCTERYRPSKNIDLLSEPSDVARWLFESRAVPQPIEVGKTGFDDARRLRKAIFEAVSSLYAGTTPNRRSVAVINEFAAKPLAKVHLDHRTWRREFIADDPVSAGLSAVARDAVDVLTGPEARLIRTCDEPSCRMLFVDTSPGARRRWCSMSRCGSRSKGETFRKRRETLNDQ